MSAAILPRVKADDRLYLIVRADTHDLICWFYAAADGERSADENAVAELIDYSLSHDGRFLVLLDARRDGDTVLLADAHDGVGTLHVDQDAAAADSMHGTQLDPLAWVRNGAAVRRSLDEPTRWGGPPAVEPLRKIA